MAPLLSNLFSPITVFSKPLPNFYISVIPLLSTELHQIHLISGDLPTLASQNGAEQDTDFFFFKLFLNSSCIMSHHTALCASTVPYSATT